MPFCTGAQGSGLENWAKEWRWPNFEMTNQRQTCHAEQVYLRAQGLNPSSSGSYLRSLGCALSLAHFRVWVVGTLMGPWSQEIGTAAAVSRRWWNATAPGTTSRWKGEAEAGMDAPVAGKAAGMLRSRYLYL